VAFSRTDDRPTDDFLAGVILVEFGYGNFDSLSE
jgi:hypothetical protein